MVGFNFGIGVFRSRKNFDKPTDQSAPPPPFLPQRNAPVDRISDGPDLGASLDGSTPTKSEKYSLIFRLSIFSRHFFAVLFFLVISRAIPGGCLWRCLAAFLRFWRVISGSFAPFAPISRENLAGVTERCFQSFEDSLLRPGIAHERARTSERKRIKVRRNDSSRRGPSPPKEWRNSESE